METASYFAKKHGLERYLEAPAELNDMIFKLLVLQETLQAEQARMRGPAVAPDAAISVRRSTAGKFSAACVADSRYRYAVESALRSATTVVPVFRWNVFTGTLRSLGIPEEIISRCLESVLLSDDTLCIDPE